jgi:hypothetical protein
VRVDLTTARDPFRLSQPSSRSPGRSGEPLMTDERGVAEFKVRSGEALARRVPRRFHRARRGGLPRSPPVKRCARRRAAGAARCPCARTRDRRASGLPIAGASVTLVGGPTIQTTERGCSS